MFYLYFNSLTFALQENGPFSKSCEVAAFPAAASRDEIEQLRVQAAAAAHSYRVARAAELRRSYREARAAAPAPSLGAPSAPREGGRAAAATEAIYQAGIAPPADAQGGSTADDVAETGSADDVALVVGPAPSLGAPSVPIVIDGSGSEHATSDSDSLDSSLFLNEPGTAAEVPAAAASGDEIEQLRRQAAAAAHSYRVARAAELRRSYREARAAAPAPSLGAPSAPREGGRAAAATEAIYQAGIAPPADAQVGSTADNAESRDEVEPLRLHEAAAIRACRARCEARREAINQARAAARREAFLQAAVAPPADAQGGSTADDARADLRLIRQEANHAAASRDEVEPLRFQGAAAIRACREARAAARREAIIQAVDPSNIPMCGVKYPNPRRNPLKRRKLE